MGIDVRKAAISDIPGIMDIWKEFMTLLRSTNPNYWKVKNGPSAFTKHLEKTISEKKDLVAVAVKDDTVVGFSLAYIETLPEWFGGARIGLVRYMAVSEGARGKGTGGQLFAFVRDWFSSWGITRIELYVLKGLQASSFWEKMGFLPFVDRRFLEIG